MHSLKVLRHGSNSFTCKLLHACLSFVSVYQMAPPLTRGSRHLDSAYYSSIDPEGMKGWVGLVGWPINERYTHINGHPSATGNQIVGVPWRMMDCTPGNFIKYAGKICGFFTSCLPVVHFRLRLPWPSLPRSTDVCISVILSQCYLTNSMQIRPTATDNSSLAAVIKA